jgi:hypothetical protein
MRKAVAPSLFTVLALTSCTSKPRPAAPADMGRVTGVQLATLEIRADQIDRFEHCPPPGEIGQAWIPPLPEWHPPSANASAAVPESAVDGVTDSQSPHAAPNPQGAGDQVEPPPQGDLAMLIDQAANATRARFRHCYHRGLMVDPTQDGHVALVLRVSRSGSVALVETWGACDLAPETLSCIRDEAARVTLSPPAGGSATVTVPVVFTNGDERRRGQNDGYAAAAYVAVEAMRPRLHECELAARRSGESVFTTVTLRIRVDAHGRPASVGLDSFAGGRGLAGCTAEVMRDATFPPPPAGRGVVIAPIAFNPRPGSR